MLFIFKTSQHKYLSKMLVAIIPLYQTGKLHKQIDAQLNLLKFNVTTIIN